jgi:hypothetical protein
MTRLFVQSALAGVIAVLLPAAARAAPAMIERMVKPSALDPAVTHFDEAHVIVRPKDAAPDAPLALFMPGTSGRPQNVVTLLRVAAAQGYPTIGLEYDDEPAVVQVCPRQRDADCSAQFRRMRVEGTGPGVPGVQNSAAESISGRLSALLKALDKVAPTEGWGRYLDGDRPRWDRIVVSGLSQGAGMAAYIGKTRLVRRVVLFSSPWDFTLPGRKLAPWIAGASATPPSRWYAEYHRREATADLLAKSYDTLGIPAGHVLVFDRSLPGTPSPSNPNPFHGSTVRDVGYAPQWRTLYGKASDPAD